MADLFISYSKKDKARIQPLVQALEQQGLSVFWDRLIPAGQPWRSSIDKALKDARCVIVVWSSHSIESGWVSEEANEGLKRGILVPVLLDSVEAPIGFRRIQTADLSDWELNGPSPSFQKLVQDINLILGGKVVTRDPPKEVVKKEVVKDDVSKRPLILTLIAVIITVASYLGYQQWKPGPAEIPKKVQIKSMGNTTYFGYYLNAVDNGKVKITERITATGAFWLLITANNGNIQLKNLGNSAYNGYYLDVGESGIVKMTNNSTARGTFWEVISVNNGNIQLKNLGNTNKEHYLKVDLDGKVRVKNIGTNSESFWKIE